MCLGIPGQVTDITDAERMLGTVDVSGVKRVVNLSCVAGDGPLNELPGQWVLVHVGFAMSLIDADEAASTLQALEELGEAMHEIEAITASNKMLEEAGV